MKLTKLTEAGTLAQALRNRRDEHKRVKDWTKGRLTIDGSWIQMHKEFIPAIKALILTSIEASIKSVEDQLRAIGVDPDEGES